MRPDMIGPRKLRPAGSFGEPLFQMTQEDSHRVLKGVVEPMIARGQVNGVMPGAHAAPKPQPKLWVMEKAKEQIPGGLAEGKPDSDFDPKRLMEGMKVEMEHTGDPRKAQEIAKDHLTEDKDYYKKLAKMEKAGSAEKPQVVGPHASGNCSTCGKYTAVRLEATPGGEIHAPRLKSGRKTTISHCDDCSTPHPNPHPSVKEDLGKMNRGEWGSEPEAKKSLNKSGAGYHMHYQRWHDTQAENPDHPPEIRAEHRQAANLHVQAVREEQKSPSPVKFGMRSPGPAAREARYATLRLEKKTGQKAPGPESSGVGKAIAGQQTIAEPISPRDPMAGTHFPKIGGGDDLHVETAKHEIQADHFSRQKGGALRSQFHARSAAKLRALGGSPTVEHRKQAFRELPPHMSQLMRAMDALVTKAKEVAKNLD